MNKQTAYFAVEKAKGCCIIVEVTEGECTFKEHPRHGVFSNWEKAKDVAMLLNRTEKRLTFSQSDRILASVLLARTRADLVRQGKGYFCKCRTYNPIFAEKCEGCGKAK
jgi:hypothetical protein